MTDEEIKKYNKWQNDLDNLCDSIKFYICLCLCIFIWVYIIVLIITSIIYFNESNESNEYNEYNEYNESNDFILDDKSLSQ